MMKKWLLTTALAFSVILNMNSQTGSWRSYMSYHNMENIATTGKYVYVQSNHDLYCYNTSDKSITTFDKVTNLSDTYITNIAYCKSAHRLVVVYLNGNIDLIDDNLKITNISDYYIKSTTLDKTVNSIMIDGKYAYLSTNFGIVKINVSDAEINNTYTLNLKVKGTAILNNKIYAQTMVGMYSADMSTNLLDVNNWKCINNSYTDNVYNVNGKLICVNILTLFQFSTTTNELRVIDTGNFSYFNYNDGILTAGNASSANVYYTVDNKTTLNLNGYADALVYDKTNDCCWSNGKDDDLISFKSDGTPLLSGIIPNSPKNNYFFYMNYKNDKLYVCGGGASTLKTFHRPFSIYTYDGNSWYNFDSQTVDSIANLKYYDINSLAIDEKDNNHIFATSSGEGLFEFQDGKLIRHYNNTNSPLMSAINKNGVANPYYYLCDASIFDNNGNLWLLNSLSKNALIELVNAQNKDTTAREWKVYNNSEFFDSSNYTYGGLRHIIFDNDGTMWFADAHYTYPALYHFDPTTGKIIKVYDTFVNEDGTNIGVWTISSLVFDSDNNLWLATDKGPLELTRNEITSGGNIFVQVKVPRNDGTNYADYLLNGVEISCITLDGAGRKWFGTASNGVYLISADNMEMIHHFLTTNSPLLSNNIESIAINGKTGEVYFGTYNGLVSYISDSTTPTEDMTSSDIYAYPNPVTPDYTGLITITGLSLNADVKILTSNGVKVAEGKSNGGSFTWDGCDNKGKRVASGIYYVAAATSDGQKGNVCKIAILK